MPPALSVLLPVHNAQPFLAASLASLTRQSFGDFEIIAVNDGSTDDSGDALERAARREPRLRVVHAPRRGLPAALTTALEHARGQLLARHDADDVCHRERFERQIAFLRAHRDVAVVGTRIRMFPAASTGAGMLRWARWHNTLLTHDAMAAEALIDSPLCHGTALLRREPLEQVGGWIERGWAEDVDLWLRMLAAGARLAKVPRVLYGWRQHASSSTRTDPRYTRTRYDGLRLHALLETFLRDRPALHLIGVGEALASWSRRLRAAGCTVNAVEWGRPRDDLAWCRAPMVLAFSAYTARERWRARLGRTSLHEGRDFVFVA